MNPREYQEMFDLEESYWWFVGRRAIIDGILKDLAGHRGLARILDLGCGTGANLEMVARYGRLTVGSDFSSMALELAAQRPGRRRLACSTAEALPFPGNCFEVITCLDVLEHLQDDCQALREIDRVLKPGHRLIATVPAYPWLWSEHDEALDHFRRYTRESLLRAIRCAGLIPERVSYLIAAPLFPTILLRLVQGMVRCPQRKARTAHLRLPGLLNRLLIDYLFLEGRLLRRVNLPLGISLLIIARKSSEGPA
jgi:SAM-dependent methyltransferase